MLPLSRRSSTVVAALGALLVALCVSSRSALAQGAPSVDACATAYEEAQLRQSRGALLEARDQAALCANVACPAEMVGFCAALASDIERSIPTIVVAALDAAGADVAGVTLVIDGKAPAVPLDGRPIALDPGEHRLALARRGERAATVELAITVRAGEKNRRVEGRFPAATPGPASPVVPGSEPAGDLVVPAIVAFSIGGVGLVFGAITGGIALSEEGALADVCATPTTCPSSERGRIDRMELLGTMSTVGFVVGGLGVATGVVFAVVGANRQPRERSVAPTASGLALRF